MSDAFARHAHSSRCKALLVAAIAASTLLAASAEASVITTLDHATPRPTVANAANSGMSFSSTGNSLYGYSGSYGLAGNGQWNGNLGAYIGLDTSGAGQFMTITFDSPVASVLAFLNYAPGYGTPYIAVYNAMNQLIESYNLNLSTPSGINAGADFGFSETSNIIKSIRFGNAYIVARDIETAVAAVPAPGTLPLLGLGIAVLAIASRRRRNVVPGLTLT